VLQERKLISSFAVYPLLFIPAALLALAFAKGFGPIAAACIGAGLPFLWYKKMRLPTMIVAAVAILTLIYLPMHHTAAEIALKERSAHIRTDMWAETIEYLRTRPILGAGLASYSARIAPYRIDTHIEIFHLPHNLLLSIWVNIGLIGLMGFLWIIVWFMRVTITAIIKCQNNYLASRYILASMIALLLTGLIDTPYIKNDLSLFFWFLIASAIALDFHNETQSIPDNDHRP
jgi:O-antigen ligase